MTEVKQKTIEQFNNDNNNFSAPERPALDITFNDVTYAVHSFKGGRKDILHGVSGEFRSGELTAIMGPSGAGKSSLLNILAGFTIKGSGGEVCINGLCRTSSRMRHFLKMSCYIQQEDEVRPLLTVREAMGFATHLKQGIRISICEKQKQITYLLDLLGLSQHENTMTCRLSGGQRKRLSIALELITNPPVLFLDEPTTGLDSASTSACVSLLKNLARQGRTIICTIHQPSALIFEMMDHLYTLANGDCIYQGTVRALLPHFSSLGLVCPPYHNPADFVIEVAVGEYSADHVMLVTAAAKKGRQNDNPYIEEIGKEENGLPFRVLKSKKNTVDIVEYSNSLINPAPFWYQLFYLFGRYCLIQRRDCSNLLLRLAMHFFIAIVFGIIYNNVGSSANSVFGNYIFVYGTNLFLHYTGQMAVTLSFPLEFKVLQREYLNRWYSLAPYCLATALFEIPFQIICVFTFILPSYLLTAQPMEWPRFLLFLLFLVSVCLTAQACGYLVGATTPVTLAVFIGPVITVFLSVFGFATVYSAIPDVLKIFYQISYFRVSFQGSLTTLYGFNRTNLPCYLDGFHGHTGYCQYRHPLKFLREMEFRELEPVFDISFILSVGVLAYICTVTAVWYRLTKR